MAVPLHIDRPAIFVERFQVYFLVFEPIRNQRYGGNHVISSYILRCAFFLVGSFPFETGFSFRS